MNLPKSYALYIGNAYPHKNLKFLVDAWQHIDLPLVLAGGRSVFYDRLEKLITSNNILHIGFVDDLEKILQEAKVFIFPTLMEGFGLPPLEAMKMGVPVVCSDIPVLREVLGSAAVFFNPIDQKDLVDKVNLVLKDAALRKALIKKGHEQVAKYSWEKMAKETLEVYGEALKG